MGNGEKADKKVEKNHRRHVRIWKFLYVTVRGLFKWIFKYSLKKAPKSLKGPYLVLSNHNTDLDPALVGFCFPQQMYFVASDQVYRKGFISKVLKWAFEPIAKIKGSSDTLTVMKIIRTLRSGKNVCLFPEGNRSFNGVTGEINEATGKLVKTSGATLVTFKLSGGYFTTPRWGRGIRRGKMHGGIVNIYSPEQLKEMSAGEVTDVIRKDLWENAFKKQQEKEILYKGKNRAVGFESAFYVCPVCKSLGALVTKKNLVCCSKCGTNSEYGTNGYFGNEFGVRSPYEWDCFQEEFYKDFVKKSEGLLFGDSELRMRTVNDKHEEIEIGVGSFEMFTDKLVFSCEGCVKELLISNIPDMSIFGKCSLMFTDTEGVHYEVTSLSKKKLYNARKYLSCWNIIRNKVED